MEYEFNGITGNYLNMTYTLLEFLQSYEKYNLTIFFSLRHIYIYTYISSLVFGMNLTSSGAIYFVYLIKFTVICNDSINEIKMYTDIVC